MLRGEQFSMLRALAAQLSDRVREGTEYYAAFMRRVATEADRASLNLQHTDRAIVPDILHAVDSSAALAGRRSLEVTPLDPRFIGEHLPDNRVFPGEKVKYLTLQERKEYALRIDPGDGKIYDSRGNLFDTSDCLDFLGYENPWALYVLGKRGTMYASKIWAPGKFQHSSLLAGGPVAGAGMLRVEDGVLTGLDNSSGHYKPSKRIFAQTIGHLIGKGVPINIKDVEIEFYRPDQQE